MVFTYVVAPTVTAVSPNSGTSAGGTTITVTGTGFMDTESTEITNVMKAGIACNTLSPDTPCRMPTKATSTSTVLQVTVAGAICTNLLVISDTSLSCTTPAGTAGAASVLVTTAGGTNAANSLYTYESATVIGSVSPNTGSTEGGTTLTISGSGFTGATSVTIGGQACTNLIVISDSTLTCTSPPGVPGNATIVITTPAGVTTAPAEYTYTPAPVVSAVAPSTGPLTGGTAITLTGSDFTGATAVTIGGNACTNLVVVSATTITCTTPAGSAGSASILVTTPGGTSTATTVFTYTAANPIPTLGEWAQIIMMLSLMAMAGWKSRRMTPH